MSWTFRNAGTVGTSFNAACTPGAPAVINAGDLLLLPACELLGTDTRPAAPSGWTDITLGVGWTAGAAVYAKIAAGGDSMPTIASWGSQFQLAACLVYSGGPASLTGIVDTTHSTDRAYNSTSILAFQQTGVPSNDNSLIVAISFKNTGGNASPVLTETGGLVGFNRRITSWPNAARPTLVVDDIVQGTAAAIISPAMNMNFTEGSNEPGHSTVLIFNPSPDDVTPTAGQTSASGQTPSVVGATNSVLTPLTARERFRESMRKYYLPPRILVPA